MNIKSTIDLCTRAQRVLKDAAILGHTSIVIDWAYDETILLRCTDCQQYTYVSLLNNNPVLAETPCLVFLHQVDGIEKIQTKMEILQTLRNKKDEQH